MEFRRTITAQTMSLDHLNIDKSWSLFLDRDGVINKRLPNDYVKSIEEFELLPHVLDALVRFSDMFARIVVVTNQQGIGKGAMSETDLSLVHDHFMKSVERVGARIDKIYFCPELATANPECRKPNTGMGLEAKRDFPEIDFEKSIMIGDSPSDIEFGDRLGMHCIKIGSDGFPSLFHVAERITSQ